MKFFRKMTALLLCMAIMITTLATAGAVTPAVSGDVDEDGLQTVADIILIKKVILGERMVGRMVDLSDVDASGVTDAADIMLLKAQILSEYVSEQLPTAEVTDGEVYYIENVTTGKLMNANNYGNRVNQWAYTGALTQQWKVVKEGRYYQVYSLFNDQAWTMTDNWNRKWLSIGDIDPTARPVDEQLFTFEMDEDGYYSIRPKVDEERVVCVEWDSWDDNVHLPTDNPDYVDTGKWKLSKVSDDSTASYVGEVLSDDFATKVYDIFMDHYYLENEKGGHVIKDRNYFWDWAEMIEMTIDAYEYYPTEEYKEMMIECMSAFFAECGVNWAYNDFNDDIMWMVIACARAYDLTGIEDYKLIAKSNFDLVYRRAYNDNYGGGLLWKDDGQTTKNACINAPAVIAATYLYEQNGGDYLEKAIDLFDWTTETLVQADGNDAGRVWDNIDGEEPGGNSFTYNQGTYIGAATRLYELTGEQSYLDLAKRTANYTVNRKYRNNVINDEGNLSEFYNDGHGFKGIFARWFGLYVNVSGDTEYDDWLYRNLYYGWCNRNSRDLVCTRWRTKTPENVSGPFNYYNYVVLALVFPYDRVNAAQ